VACRRRSSTPGSARLAASLARPGLTARPAGGSLTARAAARTRRATTPHLARVERAAHGGPRQHRVERVERARHHLGDHGHAGVPQAGGVREVLVVEQVVGADPEPRGRQAPEVGAAGRRGVAGDALAARRGGRQVRGPAANRLLAGLHRRSGPGSTSPEHGAVVEHRVRQHLPHQRRVALVPGAQRDRGPRARPRRSSRPPQPARGSTPSAAASWRTNVQAATQSSRAAGVRVLRGQAVVHRHHDRAENHARNRPHRTSSWRADPITKPPAVDPHHRGAGPTPPARRITRSRTPSGQLAGDHRGPRGQAAGRRRRGAHQAQRPRAHESCAATAGPPSGDQGAGSTRRLRKAPYPIAAGTGGRRRSSRPWPARRSTSRPRRSPPGSRVYTGPPLGRDKLEFRSPLTPCMCSPEPSQSQSVGEPSWQSNCRHPPVWSVRTRPRLGPRALRLRQLEPAAGAAHAPPDPGDLHLEVAGSAGRLRGGGSGRPAPLLHALEPAAALAGVTVPLPVAARPAPRRGAEVHRARRRTGIGPTVVDGPLLDALEPGRALARVAVPFSVAARPAPRRGAEVHGPRRRAGCRPPADTRVGRPLPPRTSSRSRTDRGRSPPPPSSHGPHDQDAHQSPTADDCVHAAPRVRPPPAQQRRQQPDHRRLRRAGPEPRAPSRDVHVTSPP
jgi:hypothetical protein